MELTKKRVLICDDSELIFAGLKFIVEGLPELELVGYAQNGREAIEMVRELAPDLVLMDVVMPVMDGIEATAVIKQEFPGIRTLMLTSSECPDILRKSLLAGADGYCIKDILSGHLIAAIESVSFGAVWLAPSIAHQLKKGLNMADKQPNTAPTLPGEKRARNTLSQREHEILVLLTEGLTNTQIADRLIVSTETVKTHVRHIYEKLAVRHRTEAVLEAIKRGLVSAA